MSLEMYLSSCFQDFYLKNYFILFKQQVSNQSTYLFPPHPHQNIFSSSSPKYFYLPFLLQYGTAEERKLLEALTYPCHEGQKEFTFFLTLTGFWLLCGLINIPFFIQSISVFSSWVMFALWFKQPRKVGLLVSCIS